MVPWSDVAAWYLYLLAVSQVGPEALSCQWAADLTCQHHTRKRKSDVYGNNIAGQILLCRHL